MRDDIAIGHFRYYQATVASFHIPLSMLEVVFPFIVAVILLETPERVGQAQMALMLPGLLSLLFAGVLADRMDRRKLLFGLHFVVALPAVGLLSVIWAGQLTYTTIIVFALASGTATAFVNPVRDAMLNRVANQSLQRTITVTIGLMYGMSLIGYLVASRADQFGAEPILLFYIVVLLTGALASRKLPTAPPKKTKPRQSVLRDVHEGLKTVIQSRSLLPPVLLIFIAGLFLGGPYAVLVPLMIRDIYGGGATNIAAVFIAFIAGGGLSTTLFYRTGGLKFPGRGLLVGYVMSGIALILWSTQVPYWAFLLVATFWGFGGGMCHSFGRTILQGAAPSSHRARVMSVYYLCGRSTAAFGSLSTGFLVGTMGLQNTAMVVGSGAICFCAIVALVTSIWGEQDLQHSSSN